MRGKWFLEFSEMVAPSKQDANAMKAFITRRIDRVRLAYGRRSVDLPRQCVFIGTINPDATNEYLNDDTGGRRWWPIAVGRVSFDKLQAMRDQLFAEAVDAVMKGAETHIVDREILDLARTEQRSRQTTDPWLAVIAEYLADDKVQFVTTKEIWVYALKGSESQLATVHQRRIASCLRELGFVAKVKRDCEVGKAIRGYADRKYDQTETDRELGRLLE
jgi:predicted P-loop ATPase